jgi:ubiquinone/menaquinone biosynthesis C-methylase UbiE
MSSELERVRAVYEQYDADPRVRRRWDPEAPGNRENVERRDALLAELLQKAGMWPLAGKRVMELGCGDGAGIQSLLKLGAIPRDLTAVDFRESAIVRTSTTFPQVNTAQADAARMEFPDESFDIVSLFTIFSSVSEAMQEQLAREVNRVLRHGGVVLWYDMRHRNPANSHVHPVNKPSLRRMFPAYKIEFASATLVPQLARHLPIRGWLFPLLYAVPLLHTHWAGLLQKPLQ